MKKLFSTFAILLVLIIFATTSLLASPPTRQARYIGFSSVTSSSFTVSWINGNGSSRIVVVGTSSSDISSNEPTDNSTCTANASYGSGYHLGASVYCVYNGSSGRSVTVTGLTANTTYWVKVYEYNGSGGSEEYLTGNGTLNPRSRTTLTNINPPTALSVTANSEGGKLTWHDASGIAGYYLDVWDNTAADYASGYDNLDIGLPTGSDAQKFWIMSLTHSRGYKARMRSYDNNNNESISSSWATFTTTAAPAISITGYSPSSGIQIIGETIVVSLTTNPLQTCLDVNAATINGIDVSSSFVESSEGSYQLTYTIANGNTDISDGSNLPLNITLKDFNNVNSNNILNPGNSASAPGVDANKPTITEVTTTSGNGPFKIGDNVSIGLTMSETSDFTANSGTIQLLLETGTTDHYAFRTTDQSSSNTITLTYTVQEGDNSSDLAYTNTTDLSLTGTATLKDANGNDATLTLPANGSGTSLSDYHDIVIDGIRPTVTSYTYFVDANDNTIYDSGEEISTYLNDADALGGHDFGVLVVFSETMDTGTEPTISFNADLATAGVLTIDNPSSSWTTSTTYTAFYSITDDNNDYSDVDVTVSGALDVAGNTMTSDTDTDAFSVDFTAPTVTITRDAVTNGSFSGTNDDDISFNIEFSEAVQNYSEADNVLSTTGTATGTKDAITTHNSSSYTQNISTVTGDGNISIKIDKSAFSDVAGNPMANDAWSGTFTIDNTLPTQTNLVASSSTISEDEAGTDGFYLTFTFSENMDQSVTPTISFPTGGENPTSDGTLSANSSSWSNATTFEQYYDVTDNNLEMANIDVQLSGAKDAAGNTITTVTTSNTFSIDMAKPTVSSVTASSSTITESEVGTNTFYLDIVFSEAMDQNGSNEPTISFTSGENPTCLSATSGSWSTSTTFTQWYTVSDNNLSLSDIDVVVSGGKDVALNTMSSSTTTNVFDVDLASPTVSSITPSSATINRGDIGADGFSLTITFSESMDQSTAPVISFNEALKDPINAGILTASSGSWSSSTTYIKYYDVNNVSLWMIDIDVTVSGAKDEALNTMSSSTTSEVFTADLIAPTVTSVTANHDPVNESHSTLWITVQFSENMNQSVTPTLTFPTGGEQPTSLTLNTGASGWSTNTNYIFVYDITDNNEEISDIDVNIATAQDLAGNVMTSATTNDVFSIDNVAPTLTSFDANAVTLGSNYKTSDNTVSFDIDFSEQVQNFDENDITVYTTATATKDAITVDDANAGEYTQSLSSISGDGTLSITINKAGFTDMAGNYMAADANPSHSFTIDNTPATISSGGTPAAATNGAEFYIDVTFSDGVYAGTDGTGALVAADFNNLALTTGSSGSVTAVSVVGVKANDNSDYGAATALSAGATTARIFFDATGTPNGLETIEVKPADGSSIYDDAGNATLATQTTGTKYLPDQVAPVISSISDNATYVKSGDVVTITFNIVEEKAITTNPTVTIRDNGDTQDIGTATYSSRTGSGTNASPYAYTYTFTVGAGDYADVRIEVDATDDAGNAATPDVETNAFTIDNTLPQVSSIERQSPSWQQTNGTSVTWRVTFSEDIDAGTLANTDFTVTGDVDVAPTIGAPAEQTATTVYDVTVTGIDVDDTGDPRETLRLDFTGSVDDLAANSSTAHYTSGETYIIDQIAPTFTLEGYYTDAGLTTPVAQVSGVTYLKDGTYYAKINASEALSAAPTVKIDGNGDGDLSDASDLNGVSTTSSTSWTYYATITVPANATLAIDGQTSSSITVSGTEDYTLGNVSTANSTTDYDVTGEAYYDNTDPTQAAVSVTAQNGTVVANYYNNTNNGVQLTIPIANDPTLVGGTYKVQYDVDGAGSWVDVAAISTHTITGGEISSNLTETLTDAEFTALVNDGSYINFRAVATDRAGNSVDGTASTAFTRDETPPTTPTLVVNGSSPINQNNYTNVSLSISGEVGTTYNYSISSSGGGATLTGNGTIPGGGTESLTGLDLSTVNDGTVTASATLTDVAGNVSTAGTDTEIKDIVGPSISSIIATGGNGSQDGTYILNEQVSFTVNWSESIVVTGTPQLQMSLNSSTASSYADYSTGTGTSSIAMIYTVKEDDQDPDLTHINGNLSLNGGTIEDQYGNSATLTLPNNSTFQSNNAIVIDARKPRITIQYYSNVGMTFALADDFTFSTAASQNEGYLKVYADENLKYKPTLIVEAQGSLNDINTSSGLDSIDQQTYRYHRQITTDLGTDGTVREVITVTAEDLNGNTVTATVSNGYITSTENKQAYIDCTPPTFTMQYYYDSGLSNAVADNAKLKAGTYYVKITSNETLSNSPTVTIDAEGSNNDVTDGGTVLVAGNDYKYTRTINTDALAVGAVLEDISITGQDAQGNNATNVNPTNEASKVIYTDTKAPTIASDVFVDPNSSTHWNQGNKTVTWTTGDITDEGGLSPSSLTFGFYNGTSWSTLASNEANDGSYTWSVPNLDITNAKLRVATTDLAGNSSSYTVSDDFVIDNTPPSVSSIVYTPDNSPGNGNEINASTSSLTITITYDEDMLQSVSPTVTFANPDLTSTILSLNGGSSGWQSATVYKAVYDVIDGDIDDSGVDVNITNAQDLATNVQNASNNSNAIQVDQVEPTITPVTIASDNAHNDLAKAGDVVTVTMTSDETLQGLTVNFMKSGGDAVNDATPTISNSTNTWTVEYTVDAGDTDGAVTFDIDATDLAGNGTNVTSVTDATSVTIDNTAPSAFTVGSVTTIGGTVVSGYWNSTNTSLNIDVPIDNDASLVDGDIQIIASDDNWTTQYNLGSSVNIPASNTTQTVSISAATFEALTGFGEGDVWKFKAIINDKVGNQTTGSESATSITVDQVAPTIDPVTIASNNSNYTDLAKAGETVTVTMTSDETLNDITVNTMQSGGVGVANAVSTSNTGGNNWTAYYTVNSGDTDGAVSFDIDATDLAGNSTNVTSVTDATSVTIDVTAPSPFTVGNVTSVGGTVVAGYWNSTNTSLNIDVPIANDASLVDGDIQIIASDDNWTTQYNLGSSFNIPASNTTQTVSISAATFEALTGFGEGDVWKFKAIINDKVGNQTTGSESATSITVDQVAPTIDPVTIASDNTHTDLAKAGDVVTVTMTADETLQGLTVISMKSNGVAVANATSTSNTGGNNWTAYYTVDGGDTDGNVTFDIDATDLAGNSTNVTSVTDATTVTIDVIAPAAFTVGNVTSVGGTVVAGYWNSTNTSLNIDVPIDNDASLVDGQIRILASKDNWTSSLPLGSLVSIPASNTTQTVTINEATFEGLSGFADGNVWKFKAIILDKAGNATQGNESATTITVDQTAPTITPVTMTSNNSTNNAYAKGGDDITISLTSNENLSGISVTNYTSGGVAVVNTPSTSGSGTNWSVTYNVDGSDPDGLIGFSIDNTDVAGNTTVSTAVTSGTPVRIDNTLPVITISDPTAGTRVNHNTITFSITETNTNETKASADGSTFVSYTSGDKANQLGGWAGISDDASFNATIRHTDQAGNVGTTTLSLTKDVTIPSVTDITTTSADGCYKQGDVIDFTVTFNEAVDITGTPRLKLNTSPTAYATYQSGTGNTTLTYSYTVGTENIADLDVIAIDLNGGTMKDEALNEMLDATDLTGIDFDGSHAIVIDNVAPTVSSRTPNDDATGVSPDQTLSIQFNENVSLTSGKGITIFYGSSYANQFESYTLPSANVTVVGGNTVQINPTSDFDCGTTYNVIIDDGAVVDCAGNGFAGYQLLSDWNFTTTNPPVTKTIAAAGSPYCDGDNITINVPSSESGITYKVQKDGTDIGISAVSTGEDPLQLNVNSAGIGTYTVVAHKSGFCETTMNGTVSVYALPTAGLTSSDGDNIICQGDQVTFTATGGVSYDFYLNNGSAVQSGASDTYVTSSLNNGDKVWVVATNASGCTDVSSTITTTVNALPTAGISSSDGDNIICEGDQVTFTATGGVSYDFYLNNGSAVQSGASDTYVTSSLNNGDKVWVVAINANGCTDASSTITTTVNALPTPTLSSSDGDNIICVGDQVTFTASGGTNYNFILNGGSVQNSTSTTYTTTSLADGDAVWVEVTNANGCTDISSTITTQVKPLPTAGISSSDGDNIICDGDAVTFTATPSTGMSNYEFKINGSQAQTGASNLFTTTSLNNGDVVTVVVTNMGGCSDESSGITMTVNPLPTATISSSDGDNTICDGDEVTFTAGPSAMSNYEFFVNGISAQSGSGTTYVTSSLADGDEVYVEVTNSNGCTDYSSTITTTVNPLPTAGISSDDGDNIICAGDMVTFTATPSGMTNYHFKVNGNSVQNSASDTYSTTSLNDGDQVTVEVTNANGCNDVSGAITMTVNAVPTASIVSDDGDNSICDGTTVVFTATPSGQSNYQFYLNGVSAQNGASDTYTNSTLSDGDEIWVEVTNANDCSDESNTLTITVNPIPTATISSSDADNIICSGESVTFTAGPTGMSTYTFKVNNVTAQTGASNVYITTTLNDQDEVTVEVTSNAGCSDVSSGIVTTVNDVPGQPSTISGTTSVHRSDTGVSYWVPAVTNATTYEWYYTGSDVTMHSSTSNSITIDYGSSATSGALRVRAGNTCGYGTWSSDLSITVEEALSQPVINGDPTSTSACQGSSTTFSVSSVSGYPVPSLKWQISTDGGSSYSDLSISGVYSVSSDTYSLIISNVNGLDGNYYRLYAENTEGTDISTGGMLTVTTPVTPSVAIAITTGSNPTCSGSTVIFTATPTNGGASPSYQWKVNGVNVGTDAATYSTTTLSDGDAVTVVMTTSLTCVTTNTATSSAINMTVNDAPAFTLHPTDETTVSGASVTFTTTVTGTSPSYQWKESTDGGSSYSNISDGGVYSGATTTTLVLSSIPGSYDGYKYKLEASNSCGTVNSNVATLTVTPGPTKLVITSAMPSPTVSGTAFSITVEAQDAGGTARNVGSNTPILLTGTGTGFDYIEVVSGQDSIMDKNTSSITYQIKLHSNNSDKSGATSVALTVDNNGGHELSSTTTSAFTLMSKNPSQNYGINWTGVSRTSINFNWTRVDALGTLILAKQSATSISDVPTDGNNYTANSVYGSGQSIGTSYVIFNGSDGSIAVTGLQGRTRYCFRLFAYNGSYDATRNYNLSTAETYVQRYRNTLLKDEVIDNNSSLNTDFIIASDKISPNPAKDKFTVDIDLVVDAPITISVYTLSGREITTPIKDVQFKAGSHKIDISLEKFNLAAGTYTVIIGAGPQIIVDRVVLVK